MRKFSAAVLICMIIVATLVAFIVLNTRQVTYEINVHIHREDYNALTLSHLSDLEVSWVRMDYETNITESIMETLHNEGYKVLAVIDNRTAPFTTFEEWNKTLLSIVANPVSQQIDGWEIWNEPNGNAYISPSNYREMLRCAYAILKNSTKGLIISGGLAPIDNYKTYLYETFNVSDLGTHYDYFGLHLYGTIAENLALVDEAKEVTNKRVWITEIGRPSETDEYTEDTQASYIVENVINLTPKVESIFVYELYDCTGLSPEKENHFGLLTTAYEKKQAYFSLKELNQSPFEGKCSR